MAMKDPSEWDIDYILNGLAINESDRLEFKGRRVIDTTAPGVSDIDRDLLSKALSAMANSGGGILVIGINDKTKKIDDGGVSIKIKPNGTRAWLEDLLPNLLDPRLQTFNIYEIKGSSEESPLLPERALYVVEIGDSSLAPHQATDRRYYGRVAGKSQPLSNRMVLDILNRRQFPNLNIQFFFASVDDSDPNLFRKDGKHKVLSIEIENKGPVFAQYVNSILFIPEYLIDPGAIQTILGGFVVELGDIRYVRVIRENVITETFALQGGILGRGPGRFTPILPGRKHSWQVPLVEDFQTHRHYFRNDLPKVIWELYADNAPCKKGEIAMRNIKFMNNFVDPV